MKILSGILSVFFVGLSGGAFAQLSAVEQYNPNSIDPIARYEQLFKHRVWVIVDLKEKQNKGFFARGGELTQFIINAVQAGELPVYKNDSLTTQMTIDEFNSNMVMIEGQSFPRWEQGAVYYEGDRVEYNGMVYTAIFDDISSVPANSPDDWEPTPGLGDAVTFTPRQVSMIEIMEDIVFDKRRSRLYHQIQSLTLIIPGSETQDQVQKPIGVFRYKDLYNLFLEKPGEAIWVNRYNPAENKNFAEAFKLRLFRSYLFRYENPDNDAIVDMYRNRMEAIMASEWWEMELMEKEHNLWEY